MAYNFFCVTVVETIVCGMLWDYGCVIVEFVASFTPLLSLWFY